MIMKILFKILCAIGIAIGVMIFYKAQSFEEGIFGLVLFGISVIGALHDQ